MHHNREKYRETLLLMYRTYTSAETIINSTVPSAVLEESFEHKKQIAVILKRWKETHPQDFVDIGHPTSCWRTT